MRTIKMRLNQAELLPRQIRDTVHEGTMPHCKSLAYSLFFSLFDTRWVTVPSFLAPLIFRLPLIRVIQDPVTRYRNSIEIL